MLLDLRPEVRVDLDFDAVLVVLEAVGGLIKGAQRGTARAEAQQITHPPDLRAEHLKGV